MKDWTKTGFNSNLPARNFYKLSERIEQLASRIRELEETVLDLTVRLNEKQ